MLHLNSPSEPASRTFTDRDEPKARFQRALQQPDDPPRVLVWYGVGGQGKTALRNEFQRVIAAAQQERPVALGVLDFDRPEHRDPIAAMLHLRFELAASRLRFPTFDIAFAQIFALECPGEDIRQRYPRLFRNPENELLSNLLDLAEGAADTIIGAKLLYKYGTKLVGWMRDWWADADVRSEVGELQRLPANELREQLPIYLARDIHRALLAPDAPRVVLMLDAYEALWRERQRGALRVDGWVRAVVEQASGALVVVFCRDRLRWSDLSPRWDAFLEQHLLGGLSDQDATRFLERAGIRAAAIRDRIVAAAGGLPFYLDLALDLYEHIRDVEHRRPVPGDFGETSGEVLERFRDHLSDTEVEDLEMASYLDVIDERLLTTVSRTLRGRMADWSRLCQRSYLTLDDDGGLRMHAVMRQACQEREKRERAWFYADVHRFLFEHFDARLQAIVEPHRVDEADEQALLAAARHCLEFDQPGAPRWIVERQQPFLHAGRWLTLARAFDLIDDAVGPLPPGGRDADAVWFHHHHANVLQHLGALARAQVLYTRARDNWPADDTRTSSPEYATILDALANVHWEMDRRSDAAPLYELARAIYEREPDRYPIRHAYAVFKLARLHDADSRAPEAEELYRRASALFQPLADTHPREFAGFLVEVARTRRAHGRHDEAVALFRQAFEIYESVDEHEGMATVLLELASCAAERDDVAAAAAFERSTIAHLATFGEDHPNTARARHLHAVFELRNNPLHPAVAPLTHAVDVLAESLGEEHPWTIEARRDVATIGHAPSQPT